MKLFKKYIFLFFVFLENVFVYGFGWYSHEVINYHLVFTLPEGELFKFFKKHISYFSKHAADPDRRKYKIKTEGCKHFFNIDAYDASLQKNGWIKYEDMIKRYGEKTVLKYGTLPWSILATQKELTKAFKKREKKKILYLSINLAHYIADAHTPLHLTKNYDGQETNQVGIHSVWETQLPKMFIKTYNLAVGCVKYQKNLPKRIWEIIIESYEASKNILKIEKELNDQVVFGKFAYCKIGKSINRMNSKKYATKFHDLLKGKKGEVEKQIQNAIKTIGIFILTSYIDAGCPKLF